MIMWKKINFNTQNIDQYIGRAVLIKCPKKSYYKGWKFFHPEKLVREEGHNGYLSSISYTEDWNFKLVKNKQEKYISVAEFEKMFDNDQLNKDDDSYLEVEEPEPITDDVEVLEELKR